MTVVAQDFPSFMAKSKSIVEAKDTKLKLVVREEKEKEGVYIWSLGLGPEVPGIRLRISYGASAQEAAERMQSVINFLPVGPGPALKGLGDEAYIYKGLRTTNIRFRKSKVFVDISAPSEEMAKDIANKLADLVPGK